MNNYKITYRNHCGISEIVIPAFGILSAIETFSSNLNVTSIHILKIEKVQ